MPVLELSRAISEGFDCLGPQIEKLAVGAP